MEANILYRYAMMVLQLAAANLDVLLSVLLGGLITTLVAWWFYVRASKELRSEAVELRHLTTLVL